MVEPERIELSTREYQARVLPLHHSPELPYGDPIAMLSKLSLFSHSKLSLTILEIHGFKVLIKQFILKNQKAPHIAEPSDMKVRR